MNVPTRETFESAYAGKAPWDIGRAQPVYIKIAGQVVGSVLDAGCGTGENALFFAEHGHPVVGIDFLEVPIQLAKRKAAERGIPAEFIRMDALTFEGFNRSFDSVIDCGLFHVFSDEDRERYVRGLAHVTRPDGRIFLLCFSDEEPGTDGPRRVSQKELRDAFYKGWTIESIQGARFEVVPGLRDHSFSEGGPKAWLAVIRRDE